MAPALSHFGEKDVWFVTGGAQSRTVFIPRIGQNWDVSATPIVAGVESAGAFSIAFRDKDHGMMVGGDYRKPNDICVTAAITSDGGKTWSGIDKQLPFRSAAGLGERSLGSCRHFRLPFFRGQRRDLETARRRELQQRRVHRNRPRLGGRSKGAHREVREVNGYPATGCFTIPRLKIMPEPVEHQSRGWRAPDRAAGPVGNARYAFSSLACIAILCLGLSFTLVRAGPPRDNTPVWAESLLKKST